MFSPKAVSEMLHIPSSSLRRYAVEYADFLSDTASIPGRKRRYTDNDILVMRQIRKLAYERKTPNEIKDELQLIDKGTATTSALALVPEVIQEFENIRTIIAQLEQDNQEQAERIARLEAWLTLPAWKRIFTNPPK